MEGTDGIPLGCMSGKILLGSGRAIGMHRGKSSRICKNPVILPLICLPGVESPEQGFNAVEGAWNKKCPATFLASRGQSGIAQDLHMTRNPRLALAKDLRNLANGKLHPTQKCDNS